jgi:murein DD-endopeptidase MepM/ murein hydrolase activator NlpD
MRRVITILIAGAAASGCAVATRATPSSTPRAQAEEIVAQPEPTVDVASVHPTRGDLGESGDGIVHIVQPGQTLWRIAHAYDIALETLARANDIGDPSRVAVGTPIFIPGARATIVVAPYPAPLPSTILPPAAIRPEPSADLLWPVQGGTFMRPFGEPRRDHTHAGVDIRGAHGQEIVAARDGVVAFCGATTSGYGIMVVLDHGDGVQTVYAHAQKVLVSAGDAVRRGQAIALLGRTGNATTEHCHFELRVENRSIDPMPYWLSTTTAARR